MIEEIIAITALVLIVGGAIAYVIKAKKKGQKCIGCPSRGACCNGSCKAGQPKEDKGD